uniref:Uncharacterized protein n=1 Tax=Opuntia streptacantha TaxID=393608 RepID=A0A7C9DQ65_OPUST
MCPVPPFTNSLFVFFGGGGEACLLLCPLWDLSPMRLPLDRDIHPMLLHHLFRDLTSFCVGFKTAERVIQLLCSVLSSVKAECFSRKHHLGLVDVRQQVSI